MPKATQLSAFGPAAMRRQPGEGAGEKGGRLRRSAELPQPRSRAGNTAHRGCRSWRSFSRSEGLSAGPRFVLAQAPAEGGPEGPAPDVSERRRQRRTKREWRGVEADEGPEARPDARELRRKTSTGEATQERNPASFLDEAVRRVRAKWPGSLRRSAETPTHGTQRASRHRGRPKA